MATTYTTNFSMPMMGMDDPHDQTLVNDAIRIADREIAVAQRGIFVQSEVDNNHFPKAVNQRKSTTTTAWQYCLDRWIARSTGINLTVDAAGLHMSAAETGNIYLYQKIRIPSAQLLGKTYTLAVCDGAGNVECRAITFPTTEPTSWTTVGTVYVGNIYAAIIHTGSGDHGFCVSVGRVTSSTDDALILWVDLYPGSYTLKNLPNHHKREYITELENCLRYFRLYATEAARPANGLDCSPPMRINDVSQGTRTIDGVRFYYNSADL